MKLFNPGINGMYLRDFFASAALTGFLSSNAWPRCAENSAEEHRIEKSTLMAMAAYDFADAMMVEREKE